ncbi:MAG TPA: hypothetical protein VGK67_28575 [Myxococcales bacterium]
MSAAIADIYTEAVHENLRPLYANWEPSAPLELGDYGEVHGSTFVRLGNVKRLGLGFKSRASPGEDAKTFATKGTCDVSLSAQARAGGGSASVRPSLEITFSSDRAAFFSVAGCRYLAIADKAALGDQVMRLFQKKAFLRRWAVVTDLLAAKTTTIIVSGGASASIVLEAAGSSGAIDLADAKLKLDVRRQQNIGFQLVSQGRLTPLLGLCKIQSRFLWFGREFRPVLGFAPAAALGAMSDSDEICTEQSPATDLAFSQLL